MIRAFSGLGSLGSALVGALISVRPKPSAGPWLLLPKGLAESVTAYSAVAGVGAAAIALFRRNRILGLVGLAGAALSARYIHGVTRPALGFEDSFGPDWTNLIPEQVRTTLPQDRWTWRMPDSPDPIFRPNIVFDTVPESGRRLLCDIWEPAVLEPRSGVGVIYVHGGAWHYLDKDSGTRPLFRHLTGQGHVVMDASYRLAPEADVFGMLGDVKRAIGWMKRNAADLGVGPDRIVIAGSSAGAHLALLAAYTCGETGLTPSDLACLDLAVRGVVSYYGPTDLTRLVGLNNDTHDPHEGLAIRLRRAVWNWFWSLVASDSGAKAYSLPEMSRNLFGSDPVDALQKASLASPINHTGPSCPPTLIFHGAHDSLVPVSDSRRLFQSLHTAGVPVVYHEFPHTEHGFDFFLPRSCPAAQSAVYDLDRFLALLA